MLMAGVADWQARRPALTHNQINTVVACGRRPAAPLCHTGRRERPRFIAGACCQSVTAAGRPAISRPLLQCSCCFRYFYSPISALHNQCHPTQVNASLSQ